MATSLSENFYWIGNTYLDYTSLDKMPAVGRDLIASKPSNKESCEWRHNLNLYHHLTNQKQPRHLVSGHNC